MEELSDVAPTPRRDTSTAASRGPAGKNFLNFSTLNVRGLSTEVKQNTLVKDLVDYKIDICCIQEAKIKEGVDKNIDIYRLIVLPSENTHYGNGFIVRNNLNIHRYWKISERISVLPSQTFQ